VNDHAPRKRFGQNFLHDAGIISRIVAAINPQDTDHIVEIGPGHGAITECLASEAGQLDVIEIDRDLAAELQTRSWFEQVRLHNADALQFDFGTLTQERNKLRLVGNLPYNISTPLLFHILTAHHLFRDIHVMLQKEVVQRMAAPPGSKTYGRLSVALQARCTVESLFVIKPGAFNPAPKVDSAIARLVPLAEPLISASDAPYFDSILRHAFGQRRKQLGNSLQPVLSALEIEAAGVDPQRRAETLSVTEFIALAAQMHANE
jgi:16S rRNA (adenine1518-N6/adenine1519-N6)-dimethyltransferase